MLRFDWVKKLANCYGQSFARLGIRQKKKRNLAKPYQFNIIEIGKKLANTDFRANPYLANSSFSRIKNRGLAEPFILANYYVP